MKNSAKLQYLKIIVDFDFTIIRVNAKYFFYKKTKNDLLYMDNKIMLVKAEEFTNMPCHSVMA